MHKLNHYNYKDSLLNGLLAESCKGEKIKCYFTTKIFFKKKEAGGVADEKQQLISLPLGLLMNQFMLIDIINSNLDKRRIYFSYRESLLDNLLEEKEYTYMLNLK